MICRPCPVDRVLGKDAAAWKDTQVERRCNASQEEGWLHQTRRPREPISNSASVRNLMIMAALADSGCSSEKASAEVAMSKSGGWLAAMIDRRVKGRLRHDRKLHQQHLGCYRVGLYSWLLDSACLFGI